MNGADAIIFAGGIGENSAKIRSLVCQEMNWLGVELDEEKNRMHENESESVISVDSSKVNVWVIPTNEELLIARDTVRLINQIQN
jgi:acetate kinase